MAIAEPGGPTTQAGISYQNSIAALTIGKMLNPILDSSSKRILEVRVEAPKEVDDMVVTHYDGSVHYTQAKEAIEKKSDVKSEWGKVWVAFELQYKKSEFQVGIDKLCLVTDVMHTFLEQTKTIASRANYFQSVDEWKNGLGVAYTKLLTHIKQFLSEELRENEEELWRFFSSILIQKFSEVDIDLMLYTYMPDSNQTVELLFESLVGKVSREAKRRTSYTRESLIPWLEKNNIRIANSVPLELLRSSIYACSSTLRYQKNTLVKINQYLPRSTSNEITEWLLDHENQNSIGILLDQAGSGKTVVMQEVLLELESKNQNVIAIKADQQLTNVNTFEDVIKQLDLPTSLEKIASTFSNDNGLIVIIDQLDALSLSMAHDESALNLTLDLIFRLHAIPKIRILISCRNFDYESDPRFSNLENNKKFHLSPFSDKDIETVLLRIGFNYHQLSSQSKELLKIPLHLNLFILAYNVNDNNSRSQLNQFSTLQELYQIVWNSVVMKKNQHAPSEQERAEVLFSMTKSMNQNQKVTVRKSVVTQFESGKLIIALDWLLSEGIIIEEKESLSFFHQTFFDYCYARNFLDEGYALDQVLLDSPQGLFQRPQITHILSYLRNGEDEKMYAMQLQSLLFSDNLRYHLKDHLHHWLSSIHTLKEFEEVLLERLFLDKSLQIKFLQISATNIGWFEYWKNSHTLNNFLLSKDPKEQFTALNYLSTMITLQTNEVIEFIKPLYSTHPSLKELIKRIMLQNEQWEALEARHFLETIMLTMKFKELQNFPIHFSWQHLARFDSKMTCRMLLHFMSQITYEYKKEKKEFEEKKELLDPIAYLHFPSLKEKLNEIDSYQISEAIPIIIDESLHYFVETLIQWFLEIAQITSESIYNVKTNFLSDEIFRDWYDQQLVQLDYVIKKEFINALIKLSKQDPNHFQLTMISLANQPYESFQFVVAHVYRQVPERYNSEIIQFLIEEPRRLLIGDECYESRHLIESVIPYAKNDELDKLQTTVLNHFPFRSLEIDGYTRRERSKNELQFLLSYIREYDKNQFIILKSFPFDQLNRDVKKRFMELERKYKKLIIKNSPQRIEEYKITSPIIPQSVQKMSNSQWIFAMKKYDKDFKL
ncbi:NACHT domain-containing protein, partial [Paenibacillus nuruki]|uniref:NACHT domain-containing protein n=1 Tax=Paenibacillus nuruki TaxID=1886670 RepID=UPI0009F3C5CA